MTGGGLRTLLCQIHGRKTKGSLDDGPDVRVRCGGKSNYKYKKKSIVQSLMGGGPIACMSSDREV